MDDNFSEFSLNKLLKAWIVLSVTLIFIGLLIDVSDGAGKAFILVLNTINLITFFFFILLKTRIENLVSTIRVQSQDLSINIQYNYEKMIGFVLFSQFALLCIYLINLAIFDIESYRQIIKEDGLVEYCSAFCWFLAAVIVFINTVKLLRNEASRYQLYFNIGLVMFFIVCAGEEISWGQRLLNIETPQLMQAINVQNEITLHNIGSISIFSNIFFLITVTFFLLVPFLMKKYNGLKNGLHLIHFPIPNRFAMYVYILGLLVWIFAGIRFGTLGFHPYSVYQEHYYNQMDDEIFELFAAYSFLCFSIFNSVKEVTLINRGAVS